MKRLLLIVALLVCPTIVLADDFKLCNSALKSSKVGDKAALRSKFTPIVAACTRLLLNPKQRYQYPIWQNLRGLAWYAMGEDDKALADYTAVIALDPVKQGPHAYLNRANILMDRGDFDRAISDMSEVVRMMPRNAAIYYNRGLLWLLKKDDDRAFADFNKAIELDRGKDDALSSRGLIYLRKGQFDLALRDLNERIRLKPKLEHAYMVRGFYWRQRGDLDQALADLNKAVNLTDKSEEFAHYLRGEVLRYRGELDLALRDFDEALKRRSTHVPSRVGRGLVLEKQGDVGAARIEFERAAESPRAERASWEIDAAEAREAAAARLAAYDSGDVQPAIPAAPAQVRSETSIPTPALSSPILTKPLPPERTKAGAAKQGRRVALVIGNSAYQKVPALANPQKDAGAIAASLRNLGFEAVTVAADATREKLIDALRSFANEAEKADWAMVYYAGHGIEVNGQNYLIPVDARLAADRDVQFEAVPLEQVLVALEGAKKLKLVLLDACRDNPFAPQMRKTAAPEAVAAASTAGGTVGTRSIGRGLGEVKVQGASLVVFAAKHGQTALDGEGANSPFAVAMVQRIATPGVEINKIFRLVRDDVMEATAGRQEPYTYGSLPGKEDFFFAAAK